MMLPFLRPLQTVFLFLVLLALLESIVVFSCRRHFDLESAETFLNVIRSTGVRSSRTNFQRQKS